MKTKFGILVSVLLVVGLLVAAVPVMAQLPVFQVIHGDVTIDGVDAPVGTVIDAYADGVYKGSSDPTTIVGQYAVLLVLGDADTGAALTFHVIDLGTDLGLATSDPAAPVVTGEPLTIDLAATTGPPPPQVETDAATGVTARTATLMGDLTSLGGYTSADVYFQWGLTDAYGNDTTAVTKTVTGTFGAFISGLEPLTVYHFRAVAGYDMEEVCGIDRTFTTAEELVITEWTCQLRAGWNLMSLALIPDDSAIGVVLSDISGNVEIVWSWYRGRWYSWSPVVGGTLTTMRDGLGYWVDMAAADDLTIYGREMLPPPSVPPVYAFGAGWNLIGFKSVEAMTTLEYLRNLSESLPPVDGAWLIVMWNSVSRYNPDIEAYEETVVMMPCEGYWIYMLRAGNLAPPGRSVGLI